MLARARSTVATVLSPVTMLGWTVFGLAVLAWIVAAWLNWDEFFIIAAVGLLVWLVALTFAVGRLNLEAAIEVSPARVVAGERAAGELTVTNRRRRSVFGLRLELPVGKAVAPFDISRLKGNDSTDELFVVPTERRAVIPCGPLTSVQGDPLGLVRRTQLWTDVQEIFVHPKTVALSTMSAGLLRDLEGQTTNALTSNDIAFHTLREYTRGDDLRHVHWKTSARIGNLMVRQYNDTRRSHVAVLLSVNPDDYRDDDELELSISCGASVALQALRDGQTVSVVAGGHEIYATNPVKMLDQFSAIEPTAGEGGLASALQLGRRIAPEASVAVIGVGSRVDIPTVRGAVSRAGLDMTSVVLQPDESATSGYVRVGTTTFVTVPSLDALRPSMSAVLA